MQFLKIPTSTYTVEIGPEKNRITSHHIYKIKDISMESPTYYHIIDTVSIRRKDITVDHSDTFAGKRDQCIHAWRRTVKRMN